MATSETATIISHLRRMVLRVDGAGMTDGQLLEEFVVRRDAAAFESLVRRHGPMVLGVCHRILRDPHDAEDAFQSTFLVLARKAASVSPREMVGNWLYGVAQTTAIRLRAANAKRRVRERQVAVMPEPETGRKDLHDDLHQLLDAELGRLPDRFRVPIVLCDLEGRNRKEVARQLNIPEGTLSSRLTKARRMLAKRLARHGLVVSGGPLAAALSPSTTSACLSVSLVNSTVKAAMLAAAGQTAIGLISAPVAALTEGVMKAMLLTKLKSLMPVTMAMLAIMVGVGVGLLGYGRATGQQKEDNKTEVVAPNKEVAKSDKEQLLGKWLLISCRSNGEYRMEPWLRDNELLVIEEADGKLVCKTAFKDKAKLIERFGEEMEMGNKRLWADMAGESPAKVIERFCEQTEKHSQGILKLDGRTKPKRLDFFPVLHRSRTYLGIYKLDGDTLKICWSNGLTPEEAKTDKDRPTEFSTTTDDCRELMLYKRQKETEPKSRDYSPVRAKKADAAKTDLDRLQGIWSVVWGEQGGKRAKWVGLFMVDGKRACLQYSEGQMQGGLYLEPTATPKTFDLAMSTMTIEGIYSLEGDTLRLCYGPKRPGGFTTEKGSDPNFLIMLKRWCGPEIFPYRRPDGTRAFPDMLDKENTELPPSPLIAPQPKDSKPNYGSYGGYNAPPLTPPQPKGNKP